MMLITLTTDFGTRDWFVGAMKGVILNINPRFKIADISHEIPAGDLRSGAFALAAACRFFPKNSVHVAVIDPGVGTSRDAIAVRTEDYFFVGPDNGVLSFALAHQKVKAAHRIENEKYFLQPVSRTFHGRDVFAPVAAHLSRGISIGKLGPELPAWRRLPWHEPGRTDAGIEGEIVYVDRFGNAITNIPAALVRASDLTQKVLLRGRPLCSVGKFYQAVPPGKPVAVIGSTDFLEIAVNGGNAAREHKLRVGDKVALRG